MASFLSNLRRARQKDTSGAEPLRHTYDPDTSTHRYQYTPPAPIPLYTNNPQSRHTHFSRLATIIRLIEILAAFALIGLAAHTVAVYRLSRRDQVRFPQGNTLSAWPLAGADLAPTYALIVVAVWTIGVNVLALLAGWGMLNDGQKGCFGRILYTFLFLVTVLAWAAALTFAKLPPKYQFASTDLYNWSCQHSDYEIVTNRRLIGFGSICTETTIAIYLGIAIGGLEIINFISSLFGLCGGRQRRRQQMHQRAPSNLIPFQASAYRKIDVPAPIAAEQPEMESRALMR